MYPVMNLMGAYGMPFPGAWIIEKRPETMEAPAIEYGSAVRMGLPPNIPNAWGIATPTEWIVEERPAVMWQPWFAPGGSLGRAFLPQVNLRR